MPLFYRLGSITLLLLFLTACGPNYIFQQEYTFEEMGWRQSDSLGFAVPISDTLKIYNLYLDVNHTDDYAYQNMYIRIHTTFPDQQRLTEQLSIDLAQKSGKWNGDCNGKNCQLRVNIQQGAFFNQPGDYNFTIEQYMRHDTLAAITGIGFSIEDTGLSREDKTVE